jgi:hypothetical protein
MMSPTVYEEARKTAPIHVQIFVGAMPSPNSRDTSVAVRGRVVRIFRGHSRQMRLGKAVRFFVPIIADRDGPPELGGEIRHDWSYLSASAWWEVFLYPAPGGVELVRSQVTPIRRPTWRPICGPDVKGYCCPGNLTRRSIKRT